MKLCDTANNGFIITLEAHRPYTRANTHTHRFIKLVVVFPILNANIVFLSANRVRAREKDSCFIPMNESLLHVHVNAILVDTTLFFFCFRRGRMLTLIAVISHWFKSLEYLTRVYHVIPAIFYARVSNIVLISYFQFCSSNDVLQLRPQYTVSSTSVILFIYFFSFPTIILYSLFLKSRVCDFYNNTLVIDYTADMKTNRCG